MHGYRTRANNVMEVDEHTLMREAPPPTMQLWGRSLVTERISHQKTLGWVVRLEGTGSEWTGDTRYLFCPRPTKRTPVEQRPCTELETEVGLRRG